MKLTVLAFIFGLCLAVASTNIDYPVDDNKISEFIPLDYADEIIDTETYSAFGPLLFTIKACLRTLKGANCTIKRVMSIRSAGVEFLNAIQDCNTGALKNFNALIKQVESVVSTCDDIIHLNSNVCSNGDLDDEADGQKKTPRSCYSKLLSKMMTLKRQIAKAITLSKKLPYTANTYAGCSTAAVSDLISVFTEFPSFVKTCSKLKN
ncbi:uncharacterized protein LOC128860741 [Anastrepha ludens]|uniref:uncharacterized protein LOC128860741 n=1 Tax=Anastrepha ludens TaxID=28586 RepID=UPI0023AE9CC9|nr:uncharacterized protein LOC128860741 [Anastrepha ludens]